MASGGRARRADRGRLRVQNIQTPERFQSKPRSSRLAAAQGRTLTEDQILQQIASIAKLDLAYLTRPESTEEQNSLVAETGDVAANGMEFELNFNPTGFWTTKLNVTQTESLDVRLSPGVVNWIAQRLPIWQSIIDPEIGRPWFTERYGGSSSASQYLASSVMAPLNIAIATEGKSRPQIRKYRANLSTSYRLAGFTEQTILKRFSLGGALRWEDKGAIGYYGVEQLPAIIATLDRNRPVYDKAHLYADAFVAYRTRLYTNKVGVTVQLNVRNLQEGGRLQPVSAYPDGSPNGYRIIDPRQFIFTVTFEL
ncbi:MAG: TonB-dependent receptor [Verrucomicrobia bacterium]|nr:TonB-dependent receptor [Verrucomicrobiota bacterium]